MTNIEYLVKANNPATKGPTEAYAIALGRGFFWYSVALNAQGFQKENLIMITDQTKLTDTAILRAVDRAIKKSNGDAVFELSLLQALTEMFPCR